MEDRQAINDSYYCGRLRNNSTVSVFTGNAYVVAEYDQKTAEIKWHRVVNASQKDSIYNWLRGHFPMIKVEPAKAPSKTSSRKAHSAAA
jgi:hypothetical protein